MHTIFVSDHPLVKRDVTLLRDRETNTRQFREALTRITQTLAYEATRDVSLVSTSIHTPLEQTAGHGLAYPIVLVPILRAGLGMVEACLSLLPEASVGHIGLYRNEETLEPVEYYIKHPEALSQSLVLVLDPMLATGGSAVAAVSMLKNRGAANLRLISIVAAPQGVARMNEIHPDVGICCAALDRELNANGYILPGLGDAGDRLFGTEG